MHIALIFFVLFGWLTPYGAWILVVLIPALFIHWKMFDGCILTYWECRLRGVPFVRDSEGEGNPFVSSLMEKAGLSLPPRIMNHLVDFAMMASWLISLYVIGSSDYPAITVSCLVVRSPSGAPHTACRVGACTCPLHFVSACRRL
jgi:hypothetical protein